jgi:hypothetical protein
MRIINKEEWDKFTSSIPVPGLDKWKPLFIENRSIYISMNNTEEEKIELRKHFSSIRSKLITMEVDKIIPVEKEDEDILFMQKVIELASAKNMSITIKL